MKRRQNREIMVFSISFLDVIASALGAILLLFIVQYKKTVNARVEITRSEARHAQCSQVLEWFYLENSQPLAHDEVVATNSIRHSRDSTPFAKRGTATKPNSPRNNTVTPKRKRVVQPKERIRLVDRTHSSTSGKRSKVPPAPMAPQPKPNVDPKTAGLKAAPSVEQGVGEKQAATKPMAPVQSQMALSKGQQPGKTPVFQQQQRGHRLPPAAPAPKVAVRPKAGTPPQKGVRAPVLRLPPKPKRKALATCVTSRASVVVSFYDYDEPDGDTIMVTFNGRHATKLKLGKTPTKRFHFRLMERKYNIISIKNLSNGFYPINTANVNITGCGRARWKMKQVGVTRIIYIYRK